MGSESSIYVYNQRAGDYFINFAQLTPYDKLVTTQFAEEAAVTGGSLLSFRELQ